jgi:polysaccharide deacetylase family protein (PEP-CTERM system associated)
VHATFFVLGWIAKKVPRLVREICDRGHEIASHGFYHKLGNKQSLQEMGLDLSDSKKLLEDITGSEVYGFRAPSFSISDDILKTIEDCGYIYDSSYNSFSHHGRYGRLSLKGKLKKGIAYQISNDFFELPISNLKLNNTMSYLRSALSVKRNDGKSLVLPWGGGAYFRLLPSKLFRLGVQSILKRQNDYLFYLHPWELDPQQPRVSEVSLFTRFRHYSNLHRTESNLLSFIESFKQPCFITCYRYLKMVKNKAVNGLGGN